MHRFFAAVYTVPELFCPPAHRMREAVGENERRESRQWERPNSLLVEDTFTYRKREEKLQGFSFYGLDLMCRRLEAPRT